MDKYEINFNDLSEEELPWVSSYLKCQEELARYESENIKHDSNYGLTVNYYKMLCMTLYYHNLRVDEIELNKPLKRLIKLNRIVSAKEFAPLGLDFASFNGIYFPAEVVFIDYYEYDKYAKMPTKENKEKLKVIKEANLSYTQTVKFPSGSKYAVAPTYNSKGTGYIRKVSDWEYVVF